MPKQSGRSACAKSRRQAVRPRPCRWTRRITVGSPASSSTLGGRVGGDETGLIAIQHQLTIGVTARKRSRAKAGARSSPGRRNSCGLRRRGLSHRDLLPDHGCWSKPPASFRWSRPRSRPRRPQHRDPVGGRARDQVAADHISTTGRDGLRALDLGQAGAAGAQDLRVNYYLVGDDLGSREKTIRRVRRPCAAEPRRGGYTYDNWRQTCFLKSRRRRHGSILNMCSG